eukprot:scaffold52377_cov72-Phaeocystis_antarctica.AAC.4
MINHRNRRLCRGVTRNVSTPSSTLSTPSFWCHYRSGLLSVVEIASGKRPLGHSRPCRRQAAHSASCSARQHAARAWHPAAGSWRPCAGQIWPALAPCYEGGKKQTRVRNHLGTLFPALGGPHLCKARAQPVLQMVYTRTGAQELFVERPKREEKHGPAARWKQEEIVAKPTVRQRVSLTFTVSPSPRSDCTATCTLAAGSRSSSGGASRTSLRLTRPPDAEGSRRCPPAGADATLQRASRRCVEPSMRSRGRVGSNRSAPGPAGSRASKVVSSVDFPVENSTAEIRTDP